MTVLTATVKKRKRWLCSLTGLFCFVFGGLSFRTQFDVIRAIPNTHHQTNHHDHGTINGKTHQHHNHALLTRGLPENLVTEILADFDVMTGCGYFKCFFPSRSDDTVGWLVTRAQRYYPSQGKARHVYNFAVQAYDFALARQDSHGLRHYYLQPPFLTGRLSENNIKLLATKFDTSVCNPRRHPCRLQPQGASNGFVVQKLRRASRQSIVAKLWVNSSTTTTTRTTTTLTLHPSLLNVWPTLVDPAQFAHNLQADLNTTRQLLHDYPALQVDFQFMIDGATGCIYHFDLDRLFDADLNPARWRDKFAQQVLPSLKALEEQVWALLRNDGNT